MTTNATVESVSLPHVADGPADDLATSSWGLLVRITVGPLWLDNRLPASPSSV